VRLRVRGGRPVPEIAFGSDIEEPRMGVGDSVISQAEAGDPIAKGRSKVVYPLPAGRCFVRLLPSLTSFTYHREEMVAGTDRLRLDFFERAAVVLARNDLPTVFERRVDDTGYIARYVPYSPFEVIVKNVATGSTVRKYPGLFREGHRFATPVVKLDYRTEPEDQPIAEDYLRECGYDVPRIKALALQTNEALRSWLAPNDLWDFCLLVGVGPDGRYWINSEISPDCMRLRAPDGASLDKDLFRNGADGSEILRTWGDLVASLD
jgi:phosphoribosylaminoimidazole-succinocarboxamide synthase